MKHKARIVVSFCVAIGLLSVVPIANAESQNSVRTQQVSRYEAMLLSRPAAKGSVAELVKEPVEEVAVSTRVSVDIKKVPEQKQVRRRLPSVSKSFKIAAQKSKPAQDKTNAFTRQTPMPRQPVYRKLNSDLRVPLPTLLHVSSSLPYAVKKTEVAPLPIVKVVESSVTRESIGVLPAKPNEVVANSTVTVLPEVDAEEVAVAAKEAVEDLAVDAPETLPIASTPPPLPKADVPRVAMIPQDGESIVVEAAEPAVTDSNAVEAGVLADSVFEAESTAVEQSLTVMAPAPVAYADPWIEDEAAQFQMTVNQPPLLFSHDVNAACGDNCSDWPCNVCGMTYCCCDRPVWRVRADGMFLHRSRADGFAEPLINCNCATPTVFQPDSLSMDFHGAPRVTVIRDNQCGGCDLEGNYYIVDHWTGTQTLEGPVAALGVDLGDGSADVRYESKLQNAELNMFKDVSNWSQFMLGFRWLELDEHSSVIGSGDLVPMFDRRVDVTNNLLGGQVGWRKTIWDAGGFVTANVTTKGGLFHNSIRRRTTGFGTSPLEKDVLSYVGEVDISMNCEITQCWSPNAGYQFMWIGNVAEAPDQFFSPDAIFDEATVFLHGMRVGITKTF